jgi:hypothetical protein
LLTQNEQSAGQGSCLYRGPENLKCAAGILIADEEYTEDMEETAWDELVNQERVPATHVDLIRRLQLIHDDEAPLLWASCLSDAAKEYDLSPKVVEEFKK